MSALVVSFFGGPGAGKSTLAAGVFYELKRAGYNCEFVHEYAKELTWENRMGALSNQTMILGQQYEMFRRCASQVDIIVTDTSLLNSAIYCWNFDLAYAQELETLAVKMYGTMNNLPFYVNRVFPYVETGRYQDEDGANELANRIKSKVVEFHSGEVKEVPGDGGGLRLVLEEIKRRVG